MDPETAYRTALDKRHELQTAARDIGVSEEYISELVDCFYNRIRLDPDLGPIFERVVKGNWGPHLEKMKLFWNSVALRSGLYIGKPVQVHQAITGVEPSHFATWLRLFEETLRETAPTPEAVDYFMTYARNMAGRLQQVMFPREEAS
jgi:hemoglobin